MASDKEDVTPETANRDALAFINGDLYQMLVRQVARDCR